MCRGSVQRSRSRLSWPQTRMPSPLDAEDEPEFARRQTVDVLEHERRPRDVGEDAAHRKPERKRVADEPPVAERLAEAREHAAQPRLPPIAAWERLGEPGKDGADEQDARRRQHEEDPPRS